MRCLWSNLQKKLLEGFVQFFVLVKTEMLPVHDNKKLYKSFEQFFLQITPKIYFYLICISFLSYYFYLIFISFLSNFYLYKILKKSRIYIHQKNTKLYSRNFRSVDGVRNHCKKLQALLSKIVEKQLICGVERSY